MKIDQKNNMFLTILLYILIGFTLLGNILAIIYIKDKKDVLCLIGLSIIPIINIIIAFFGYEALFKNKLIY